MSSYCYCYRMPLYATFFIKSSTLFFAFCGITITDGQPKALISLPHQPNMTSLWLRFAFALEVEIKRRQNGETDKSSTSIWQKEMRGNRTKTRAYENFITSIVRHISRNSCVGLVENLIIQFFCVNLHDII